VLERALQIEGLTKQSELELLHRIALGMRSDALVVEVGSFRGRSTVAIAEGLARVEGARLVAVDPFTGDPGWEKETASDEARAIFDRNTASIPFLEVMQMPSLDAAAQFDAATIDWIFIDGLHDYRSVRGDIRAWAPKMKPGALMSGHDYGRAGVTDAVLSLFGDVTVEHAIWMTTETPHLQLRRWARARAKLALRMSGS
jgi:predicted O-methyltransferase YrrM